MNLMVQRLAEKLSGTFLVEWSVNITIECNKNQGCNSTAILVP